MRKIVAAEFVPPDGVVESPDKWTFQYFTDEIGGAIGSQMAQSDTLLLGRRTYQEFAAVWPDRGTDEPVGNYMNNAPKLVASTTLDTVEWQNSTLIRGNVAEELAQDALVAALEQWPRSGVPRNPGAWLMAIGKRRAIDLLRRKERFERKLEELGRELEVEGEEAASDLESAAHPPWTGGARACRGDRRRARPVRVAGRDRRLSRASAYG